MAKKIYIKNGVNLDSSITVPGYKIVGYNDTNYLSNLSEKNDLGDIREIGGGSSSVASGNGVTASGTINYVSKFTDTNILGDSIIYDDGTNVGIGTASPTSRLHIKSIGTSSGTFSMRIDNSTNNNIFSIADDGRVNINNNSNTGGISLSIRAISGDDTTLRMFNSSNISMHNFTTTGAYWNSSNYGWDANGLFTGSAFYIGNTNHRIDDTGSYLRILSTDKPIVISGNAGSIITTFDNTTLNVGIGVTSPTTKLHVYGTQSGAFRLVDTTEGLNKVLTSDANGVGTWASIGSIGIGTTNKSVDTRGFTASVTETITHNLNSNSVIVQNYDSTGLQVIAGSVLITGTGSVDITFSQTLSNVKTIIIG